MKIRNLYYRYRTTTINVVVKAYDDLLENTKLIEFGFKPEIHINESENKAVDEFSEMINKSLMKDRKLSIDISSGTVLHNLVNRGNIFHEIEAEREYQDSKFGDDFDDKNTINDWITYINRYMAKAGAYGASKEVQRTAMIKAVTIGVAALESFDRNDRFAPRHYDGEDLK